MFAYFLITMQDNVGNSMYKHYKITINCLNPPKTITNCFLIS